MAAPRSIHHNLPAGEQPVVDDRALDFTHRSADHRRGDRRRRSPDGAVAFTLRGGDDAEPAASTTTAATTTTTKVATTTEPASGPVAPLTGLKVADPALVNRPALVAKIDNLDRGPESALPQAGVSRADVVFEEIVEGNITRFAAVFHSKAPGRIGPIRSARTTDVILLPQLGPVLFRVVGRERRRGR